MDTKKTVLIIEDEQDIRDVYTEVLQDSGYIVIGAGDGNTGKDMAFNQPWDLMLLDIMLPGEDGLHVLKEVKSNPNLANRPVILLTNLGSEPIINESFNVGADGYLIKSEITPDKIIAEVDNYLTP
ncbi:MAG: response regulator transcription factor [Patescibacteria group bacterium]